jgi:hypothetical protein
MATFVNALKCIHTLDSSMERDHVHFCEKLGSLGYRTIMVGTNFDATSYQVTTHRFGENEDGCEHRIRGSSRDKSWR